MSDSKIMNEHKEAYHEVEGLARIQTVDINNYHGLTLKTVLVYLACCLIVTSQLVNLVGAGAYARDIAIVVGGTTEDVWLVQAVAILTCVLCPPVSQAADYWGRKWFIVILTLFGTVGCIIVARADSMGMAIAGQVVVAVSFGSQALLYAVASEILPRRVRPAAQGGLNVCVGLGGIFGLLVGNTVVQKYNEGFRIYFYINAGLLAVSAIICAILYNPPARPLQYSLTQREKLARLDWVGYALLAFGITLFSMALSWSDNPYTWKNAHILATFLIGVALMIGLAVHQSLLKKDGMFHHDLFAKDNNFFIALVCIFVEGMVFFAANGFYSLEVSVLYETVPIRVGLRFCMAFFVALLSAACTAVYSSIRKQIRGPIVVSFLFFVIFNVLMATAKLSSSTAMWVYPIFLGAGLGCCLTCLVTAAQLSAPPALIAITSGLMISMRSLGGSVGLAIYNAIFNSIIADRLPADIAAAVLPLGLSATSLPAFITALADDDTAALATVPGVTPQIIEAGVVALKEAYLASLRYVWVAAGVFSLLAAIAACFFVDPKKDLNMHVDAPLEKDDSVPQVKDDSVLQQASIELHE